MVKMYSNANPVVCAVMLFAATAYSESNLADRVGQVSRLQGNEYIAARDMLLSGIELQEVEVLRAVRDDVANDWNMRCSMHRYTLHVGGYPCSALAAAPCGPFWESGVMENEPVLFMKAQDDAPAAGTLLFTPTAPPRLTSPDGATVYEEGRDYTWTPGTPRIALTPGSRIPFKTTAEMIRPNGGPHTFHGVLHFEGRFFHDLQTQVTYAHDGGWVPPAPTRGPMLTLHGLSRRPAAA